MRCGYKDDFTVDYSGGSLYITKGEDVELVVKEGQIPPSWKSSLYSAVQHNSCHELRSAARGVTSTIEKAFDIE
jgi:hypothetical protein